MDKVYHFSAPGRTEIGGNHTDHQHGCVIAAAVDMETTAEVTLNGTNVIRVDSEGYKPVEIDLGDLNAKESEKNTTAALIRGVAAAFAQRGYKLAGFDAKVKSTVLPGSGLSSSAAFEVLIGRILNGLFADNAVSAIEIAQIGQIDSGADHAELTDEYAAMPIEMKKVAHFFGKEVLREVDEQEFYEKIADVRKETGDRAVLRAIHFFNENRRVQLQVRALKNEHFDAFLRYVNESGMASWTLLQNVTPAGYIEKQDMAFTIALCQQLLAGEGAVRIHGGGFAGTALAFVPNDKFESFKAAVESALGTGHCHPLKIMG